MRAATKFKLGFGTIMVGLLTYEGYKAYKGLERLYHEYQYQSSPTLEATKKDERNEGGKDIGKFRITTYNTALEKNYKTWSTTGKNLSGPEACPIKNKGFYEAVRCEGAGIGKNHLLYSARSIKPTKEESNGKKPKYGCLGYTASGNWVKTGRSIAVDPEVIPLGSLVRLEFLDKNKLCLTDVCKLFNGWYRAEDTGGSIKGERIDTYIGTENGRTYNLGKYLPKKANVYLAKNPGKDLEIILKNRNPNISIEPKPVKKFPANFIKKKSRRNKNG